MTLHPVAIAGARVRFTRGARSPVPSRLAAFAIGGGRGTMPPMTGPSFLTKSETSPRLTTTSQRSLTVTQTLVVHPTASRSPMEGLLRALPPHLAAKYLVDLSAQNALLGDAQQFSDAQLIEVSRLLDDARSDVAAALVVRRLAACPACSRVSREQFERDVCPTCEAYRTQLSDHGIAAA